MAAPTKRQTIPLQINRPALQALFGQLGLNFDALMEAPLLPSPNMEPDEEDKARVDAIEKELRESLAQALYRRKEVLSTTPIANCSCAQERFPLGNVAPLYVATEPGPLDLQKAHPHPHWYSLEHQLATIYFFTYGMQGATMPPARTNLIAALRPRAAAMGPDVADAFDAIVESKEPGFMALAMRFVALAALGKRGG